MIPVVIGLSSAVVFGAADFFGGLASRRISPLTATLIAVMTGLALMGIAAPLVGGRWSVEALLWGGLGGVGSAIAILLLYAALAIGPMSILSPLTAVLSAVVPMVWGLAEGERLTAIGYLALALALVAIVLVGVVPGQGTVRPSTRGLLYAVGSGVFMGLYLTMMSRSPDDSGLYPLLANRVVSALLLGMVLVIVLLTRRKPVQAEPVTAVATSTVSTGSWTSAAWRVGVILAVSCGLLDSTANSAILWGLRLGELSVLSVLVALYPAGTILLAGIVLRERVAPLQWVGLGLAVLAAALLSSHRELSAALSFG